MFEKKMITITIQPTDQGPDILISSQNRGLSTSPLIIALAHDLLQEQSIKDRYSKLKRDEALEIKFRLTRIWFLINPRVRIVKYQNWYFNLCINPFTGFMFFTRAIMKDDSTIKGESNGNRRPLRLVHYHNHRWCDCHLANNLADRQDDWQIRHQGILTVVQQVTSIL